MAKVILDSATRREQRFEDREELLYSRIEKDREAKRLSQEDMAGNLGISQQLYSYKIKNHALNTLDLLKIISALNWNSGDLQHYLGKEDFV